MQQVADWLEKLGLGQYAQRFAENGIDFSVLGYLTDQDLEKIGVLLGHRRKMLAAIGELAGLAQAPPQSPLTGAKPQDTAERRQVTVMFSDLVGSTALSARMDPEDLREVISAYQKCVAETVQRFGGFVAKYMGDGVLVYFGYPQAHEDDAERAVRAGLELIQAVGGLKSSTSLQTRVGIATGLVVVGDLIGSGAAQEQTVIGETPNLAARLQGIAEPNTVVIAESTRKLLGNLFEFARPRSKDLKGDGRAGEGLGGLRRASAESRFEALHASGLTELVGREEELELLLRRWSKVERRRRPSSAPVRRGRYWQIAAYCGAYGTPGKRTAHAPALLLFSAAHRQRPLSGHRSDGTGSRTSSRRYRTSEARQARCSARSHFDLSTGRVTLCRHVVAAERRTLSRARHDT